MSEAMTPKSYVAVPLRTLRSLLNMVFKSGVFLMTATFASKDTARTCLFTIARNIASLTSERIDRDLNIGQRHCFGSRNW